MNFLIHFSDSFHSVSRERNFKIWIRKFKIWCLAEYHIILLRFSIFFWKWKRKGRTIGGMARKDWNELYSHDYHQSHRLNVHQLIPETRLTSPFHIPRGGGGGMEKHLARREIKSRLRESHIFSWLLFQHYTNFRHANFFSFPWKIVTVLESFWKLFLFFLIVGIII